MNSYIKLLATLLLVSFLGCASANNTNNKSSNEDKANSTIRVTNLHNYIKSIPRLTFTGGEVINTAVNTFTGNKYPLYVLDGVQIGTSYAELVSLLDRNQYVTVEFLKISKATVQYGEAGKNGVIVITTG
ncbi:MAG: TonB-dependent receptor plug domain-containing protein [Balneolaceae bacterium]|nr:TonB-dependent receptor plug domain-containing protein [Balneolaceae bacterium]